MTDAPADSSGSVPKGKPAKLCDCDDLPLSLPGRSIEMRESTRELTIASVSVVAETIGTSVSSAIDRHHGPPAPDLHQTGIILLI